MNTTQELRQAVEEALVTVPKAERADAVKKSCARTFQALRIELNHELDVLRDSLDGMIDFLNDGGRICIITFHSLEDRIVKQVFQRMERPCTCPPSAPVCICGKKPTAKILTRKPLTASQEELQENSRAKSAKLRAMEKI